MTNGNKNHSSSLMRQQHLHCVVEESQRNQHKNWCTMGDTRHSTMVDPQQRDQRRKIVWQDVDDGQSSQTKKIRRRMIRRWRINDEGSTKVDSRKRQMNDGVIQDGGVRWRQAERKYDGIQDEGIRWSRFDDDRQTKMNVRLTRQIKVEQ